MTTNTPKAGNGVTDAEVKRFQKIQQLAGLEDALDDLLQSRVQDAATVAAGEPDNCDGWELLAMALASEDHDDIHYLIWEGGPVPEPWGEVWQKYEGEAKRMIALVREHATPAAGAGGSVGASGLSDERLWELRREAKDDPRCADQHWFILFARAAIAEARIAQSPELSCWFGKCATVEACAEDGCSATPAPEQATPRSGVTDAERLDWIEAQANDLPWMARQSATGRGYRLHQDPRGTFTTARAAIDAAIVSSNSGEVKR